MMQSLPILGIVPVTGPQDLAGMVVRKAAHMAQQMQVPIPGPNENMSHFKGPDSGRLHAVFGLSHAEETAQWIGAPLLGLLPLYLEIAMLCDMGCLEDYTAEVFAPSVRDLAARAAEARWQSLTQMHPGFEGWQD